MLKKNRTRLSVLLAALLLSACISPGPKQSSNVDVPQSWSRLSAADMPLASAPAAEVEQQWWRNFGDTTLDALITEALISNKTLQIAKARIEEARANRGLARSSLFPEVNATGGISRSNQGFATNNGTINIAQANLEATWELDIFGRNQARTRQAGAILESEEASAQAVRLGLLAEVARNYFDLRNYERQLVLTRANLASQQRTLELIQAQFRGGFSSDFDVSRAGAQVSTTAALIPVLQAGYDASLNRINILLGNAPGAKDQMLQAPQELKPLNQRILVAAPATVLAARPDVRAAERRFAASISGREAATAELFPNISLTAFFGVQSAGPLSTTPWGLGGNLIQPILNFGRIQSEIDAADARQKQAFLGYQETVLEALENMENALSSYLQETQRNGSLTSAVTQDRRAANLAQQQYTNGFTSLLDVLVAERDLLEAEANQAASDASLRKNLVAIYTAAGGGWKE